MSQPESLTHLAPPQVGDGYIPDKMPGLRQLGALLVSPSAELPSAERPSDDAPKSLARRLVEEQIAGASGNEAAAMSLLVERVFLGLARWFGPYGAMALVTRAITRVRPEHPLLANVLVHATIAPYVTGWPIGTAAEVQATLEAATAVLASLHESLTRLIGDDLAETLLAQSGATTVPSPTEIPVSPNASQV